MQAANTLIILADEHQRDAMGAYGHKIARTPNLDALAARGTRFGAAYTTCPICVPARASLATGLPVHALGTWDNGHPYRGAPRGWAHALRDAGREVVSIGKLHYRDEADDTGFSRQINPLHVLGGIGDLRGMLRDPLPPPRKRSKFAERVGAGESGYTRYDRSIADAACDWIGAHACDAAPWTLFISFVCPHHPLIAPEEFLALHPPAEMPLPRLPDAPRHPWVEALRRARNDDDFFDDDRRRLAVACYYGLCGFVDAQIGRVLHALDRHGQTATTRVIYSSDHGENLGVRGLWGKYNLYEEAAAIPLLIAGPDVPEGHVCRTPVSLLDMHPTMLDSGGLPADDRPGASLIRIANAADVGDRAVLSEYHATGSPSAAFMVRRGRWKLIHYAGFAPELFDLDADPGETTDRAADPAIAADLAAMRSALSAFCDPDDVDRRAKHDQAAIIASHGGREAVLARGFFQGTPAPGDTAELMLE